MNNILMLFIFVPILSGILLLLNFLLAPKNAYESKVSAYECGFSPIYGQTRNVFHINFFLVALLFLIFDLEILLLFPIAVTLYNVSVFGFSVVLIFFIVLTIGFILEIGSGSISMSNKEIKSSINPIFNTNTLHLSWTGMTGQCNNNKQLNLNSVDRDTVLTKVSYINNLSFVTGKGPSNPTNLPWTPKSIIGPRVLVPSLLGCKVRGGGLVAYSFIDKVVTYNSNQAESILQAEIYRENIHTSVSGFKGLLTEHLNVINECRQAYGNRHNENVGILDNKVTLEQLQEIKNGCDTVLKKINESKYNLDWYFVDVYDNTLDLLKGLEFLIDMVKFNGSTSNFLPGITDFFKYLEGLSLLHHSSLLHISLFLYLIITTINILAALFGNEIIRLFNLEQRFHRLSLFFKVRATLQKYYLMWNVLMLLFCCIFGIGVNILTLIIVK